MLLVNVSDQPIQATLDFDAAKHGLPPGSLTLTPIEPDRREAPMSVPRAFRRPIPAGPRKAWAWEIAVP